MAPSSLLPTLRLFRFVSLRPYGQSIEESILSLLEHLVMAKNAPKTMKTAYLIKAGGMQEVLIMKIRLLLELKLSNETKVFQLQGKAEEIGRMLGGWLKSTQS